MVRGPIVFCGDTHGKIDFNKVSVYTPDNHILNSNTKVPFIVTGDWGGLFYTRENTKLFKKDREHLTTWIKKMNSLNLQLVVVLGNHENYDLISKLPEIEMFSSTVKILKVYHHFHKEYIGDIFILKRGEIYNINGHSIWTMGGALSIDKNKRTLGIDYWEEEIPSYKEFICGMENLDKVDWKVDVVVTHTAPKSIIEDVIFKTKYTEDKFKDPVAQYLEEIYKKIQFEEWHFGHFHTDVTLDYSNTNDGKFFCHYNKIYEKL